MNITDNVQINKDSFSQIPNLVKKISNKTLEQLEHEGIFVFPESLKCSSDLSEEQFVLQEKGDFYCTGNVVGFIGYKDERLSILSRFSPYDDDCFFKYLLSKMPGLPNIVDLEIDAERNDQLFNYLLFLFPYYLKKAMRKGLFKKYIQRQYNDENVKGTIDIARHIKLNTPFIGNIAYNQREFAYDNFLTEIIRHTVEYIKTKSYGNNLLARAKDEVNQIIEATPAYQKNDRQKIIYMNKKSTIRHAFYHEYHMLQRLCLMILQHQKHQIGIGSNRVFGILFDCSWLWEEYLNSLLSDNFFHPMNKSHKDGQQLFSGTEKIKGLIYPDFISKNTPRIIADAKYKPRKNIKDRDYPQVLAYMFRFESKCGFYLYPETDNVDDEILWLNKGTTFDNNVKKRDDVCVIKHGLLIPQVKDYDSFVKEIKENEKTFIEALKMVFVD